MESIRACSALREPFCSSTNRQAWAITAYVPNLYRSSMMLQSAAQAILIWGHGTLARHEVLEKDGRGRVTCQSASPQQATR